MQRSRRPALMLAFVMPLLLFLAAFASAQAPVVSLFHGFQFMEGINASRLLLASDGNFYGVASSGGSSDAGGYGIGTFFKVAPDGTLTVLYVFRQNRDGTAPAGAYPIGHLAEGNDACLYGVTQSGGVLGAGTVFKITKSGVLTTLHSFAPPPRGGEGADPVGGLTPGPGGAFYGVTEAGGHNNEGTVFMITFAGVFTTLHLFTDNESDIPVYPPIVGDDGALYGTTGGNVFGSNYGSVYRLDPAAAAKDPTTGFKEIHIFFSDGRNPYAQLVKDSAGDFYGTTFDSTKHTGTVYKITPAGDFTPLGNVDKNPGQLVIGTDSNLYGTTSTGGASNGGTLFKMSPAGSSTVLYLFPMYDFNNPNVAAIGTFPYGGLVTGPDGNFYGVTVQGGVHFAGTIFKLDVGLGNSSPVVIKTLKYAIASTTSTLTIDGSNFDAGSTVTVDALAPPTVYKNGSLISKLSPSLPPGDHLVTVTNSLHQKGSKTLTLVPVIQSATAVTGDKGTDLVVTGVNFPLNLPAVLIDGQRIDANVGASTPTQLVVQLLSLFASGKHTVEIAGVKIASTVGISDAASFDLYPAQQSVQQISFFQQFATFLQQLFHWSVDVTPAVNAAPTQLVIGNNPNLSATDLSSVTIVGRAGLTGLIGNDGGSLIGNDGGSLIGNDGGSLISNDGGSLIGNDGGSLIYNDGSSVIGVNGGNVIGVNGGNIIGNASSGIVPVRAMLATVENQAPDNSMTLQGLPSGPGPQGGPVHPSGGSGLAISFSLTKHIQPGLTGPTDAAVSTLDINGHPVVMLRLRYTPGSPDLILYEAPGVTVTPGPGTTAALLDVSDRISVTRSAVVRDSKARVSYQILTLTNKSSSSIKGPFRALITGLTSGVSVVNATGTFGTTPYLAVAALNLAPQQATSIRVNFVDPGNVRFNYGVSVYGASF